MSTVTEFIPNFTTQEYIEGFEEWSFYMEQRKAFDNATTLKNKVKTRDNYACVHCGRSEGVTLCVHHKNGCRAFPEQALNIDNLVTLCFECHMEFHRIYGFGQNNIVTEQQFEEWQLLACGVTIDELPNGCLQPRNIIFDIYLPTEDEIDDIQYEIAKKEMERKQLEKMEEMRKLAEQAEKIHKEQERMEEERRLKRKAEKCSAGYRKCNGCGEVLVEELFTFDSKTCKRSNTCDNCKKNIYKIGLDS